MTIQEIKKLTEKTEPYFFAPNTMRFFGQSLSDFKVIKQSDNRYKIIAPSYDHLGNYMGDTIRYFNPKNNKLELS